MSLRILSYYFNMKKYDIIFLKWKFWLKIATGPKNGDKTGNIENNPKKIFKTRLKKM